MSSSFYEIHELSTGEIILKRSEDEAGTAPLVSIRFSSESLEFLGRARFEVAKRMIEAGMEAASELADQSSDFASDTEEADELVFH